MINCPKCGFHQPEGEECRRCGVIFARCRTARPEREPSAPRPKRGLFRRVYGVFRWFSLAGSVLVLILILRPSAPPPIEVSREATERAAWKIREFQESMMEGRSSRLEMDQSELNGWLGANLGLARTTGHVVLPTPAPDTTPAVAVKEVLARRASPDDDVARIQSAVKEVRIRLKANTLLAHVGFELYGKEMSLELEGELGVKDGYLRLTPTAGKLGSLPLLAGTLEAAARRLFESPENKEKFKLPPEIQDVFVEEGRLVVSAR